MKIGVAQLIKIVIGFYNKNILHAKEEVKLFQLNTYSRLVLLNIMHGHYTGHYLSAEQIIKNIDGIYGSRASIIKCLNKAYKLKLIQKDISTNDKRRKKIIPTKKLINYFEYKITHFKKFNVSLTPQDSNYFVI
jgi:hypothetical protein